MGPCAPWVTEDDLPDDRPSLPSGGPSWSEVTWFASDVLYDLSGRRWAGDCGQVTATLMPGEYGIPACCGTGSGYPDLAVYPEPFRPVLIDGQFWNVSCCTPDRIRLPDTTARDVTSVTERGAVRDPSTYRLKRNGWLVDTSLRGWWACGSGIEVTYSAGVGPPAGGVVAARLLSVEIGKALAGLACQLPARVTQVVRQGVTFGVLDRWQDLDKGRTGLYLVDLWLSSVTRPVRGSAVWSPDLPTAERI